MKRNGVWTKENLQSALQMIRNGSTEREAATVTGVPRATIGRYQRLNLDDKKESGRPSVLNSAQEDLLVDYLLKMEAIGFGLTSWQVREVAFEFCARNNIRNNFNSNDGVAGWDWFMAFMQRHKDKLSIRKPEKLSKARAMCMNWSVVEEFYCVLDQAYARHGFDKEPQSIYNVDETGFTLVQEPAKIVAMKGKKTISVQTAAEKGDTTTVIAGFSAVGEYLPPYVIMKGVRKMEGLDSDLPANSNLTLTESGWSTKATFIEFIRHFGKHCRRTHHGWTLLVLDGHGSHADSLEALLLAQELKVDMICLPPHSSHWLQPADRSFFKPLKTRFHSEVGKAMQRGERLNRYTFGKVFTIAWNASACASTAINGFRACGIFPLNRLAVPSAAYTPSMATERPNPEDQSETHTKQTDQDPPSVAPSTSEKFVIPKQKKDQQQENLPNTEIGRKRQQNIAQNEALLHSIAFEDILPPPVFERPKKRNTATHEARLLTSSENIQAQLQKETVRGQRKNKQNSKQCSTKRTKNEANLKLKKRKPHREPSEKENDRQDANDPSNFCSICSINFFDDPTGRQWIQCTKCQLWQHQKCVGAISLIGYECIDCVD